MGELKDRIIRQTRDWLDGSATPVPPCDWNEIFPITVYDAVRRSFDTESTTLTDEIEAIYRLINDKQTKVDAGTPGNLMTWSGIKGQIGSTEVTKKLNDDSTKRSHNKIPTERAVGDKLDAKTDIVSFNAHAFDTSKHISDTERTKWNAMAPLSALQNHIANEYVHVTESEKSQWNLKAEKSELEQHVYDLTNPHNVSAHQVDAYTRREVDEMFSNLQASFFNYVNISWDSRTNVATLVKYHSANYNPNYILKYGEELPTPPDNSSMYFALVPATDYRVDESQECILWIKKPGLTWQEVGMQPMQVGDMVIRYPDASMYVWTQGRFILLFTDNNLQLSGNLGGSSGTGDPSTGDPINPGTSGGTSDLVWRPQIDDNGNISWVRSNSTSPPLPVNIHGKDGYTPIKGVDYFDGNDGQGVPVGGYQGQILVKLTDDNYDTTWKSLNEAINELVIGGLTLPAGIVKWEDIVGKPISYNVLGSNENGFITQKGITEQFDRVNDKISDVLEKIEGSTGVDRLQANLTSHVEDFSNPHRVTPTQIGAVTNSTFLSHSQDFENPHNVTAAQIGLGNVDNTRDLDKPISNAVKDALDEINRVLNEISGGGGVVVKPPVTDPEDPDNPNPPSYNFTYISDVKWDPTSSSLIFTYNDGEDKTVGILLEDTFKNISYDADNYELIFVLPDGSKHAVDFSQMAVKGSVTSTIQVTVDAKNTIKASILPDKVGTYEIATSVALRGSPTTTTQIEGDNSTRIATTEFVHNQVLDNLVSYDEDRPLSANMGRLLNQRKVDRDEIADLIGGGTGIGGGFSVIDSLESTSTTSALSAAKGRDLNLTKAPRVHTSPNGATFGRATVTEFGHVKAANVEPQMDGTVFKGTDDGCVARADHRHPTDITRAPMHFPDVANNQYSFTGEPRSTLPPDNSNDDRIATTAWIRRNSSGTMFGRCKTDGKVAVKEVTLESSFVDPPVFFLQQKGSTVAVLFENTDTSGHSEASITQLKVEDNAAAPIVYCGGYLRNNMIVSNMMCNFTFDGYFWHLTTPVVQSGVTQTYGPGETLWPEVTVTYRIYVITFNPNNGSVDTPKVQTNKWGKLDTIPTPTRENYNFRGWFTALEGGQQINDQYMFSENTTVYARWAAAPKDGLNIIFDPMKGSIMTETVKVGIGQPIGDNLIEAVRENYKFLGWYTKPILGGERVDEDTTFQTDTTLYARWQQDTSYEPTNVWTGYTGKVVIGDGTANEDGCFNYVRVSKQYDIIADDVRVDISTGELDFSVEMADGTQQPATNPKFLGYAGGMVILQFQIGDYYSPGEGGVRLQYSNKNAYIRVLPKDEVGDIVNPGDIKYPDAPVLTNPQLPSARVGVPYSKQFEATGETPIYWIVTEGELPPGLYLDMEQGILAGTPTAAGRYPFNVQGVNNSGTLTASMSINVEYEAGYEE